jgi:L-2,4-diaminobutyrate decarboxylase
MTSPPDILSDLEADAERAAASAFVELAAKYLLDTRAGAGPVSTPLTPEALARRFAEPLPRAGRPLAEVLARLERDVLSDVNRLAHPMYLGHQVAAPLPAAIWTDTLVGALNQSTAVWEMSPSATVIETQLVQWLTELVGWGSAAGGTFTSGGTEATCTALLAARAAVLPDAWAEGVGADPPVVLCGEHSHYSVQRAVGMLGLGTRHTIAVPSREWRMDPDALVARLDELARAGRRVLAVVATAGSTPTGSFDDLETIGAECERRGIWLHVDGAHGASALLSVIHGGRLRGIHHARSVSWDAHKMLLLPLSAGMLLVREERDLERAFAQQAPYIFHRADEPAARNWDQGPRSFLCSRRADALKLWVALQRYGAAGLGALYDHLCTLAQTLHGLLQARPEFEALHCPEANIVCFRWVGAGPRDDPALDALNAALRARYNQSGAGWITTTVLGGRRVLRVTVMNPRSTPAHLERLLDGLAAEAAALVRWAPGRSARIGPE